MGQTSALWLRWRKELRRMCSEMRLTAADLGVSKKDLIVRQQLFDAANRVEECAYKLDAAILAAAAEEE